MKISPSNEGDFNLVDLTYNEELAIANCVMSVLGNYGTSDTLRDLADDMYFAGTNGNMMKQELLEDFLEGTYLLIKRYHKYDKGNRGPSICILEEDDKCMVVPSGLIGGKEVEDNAEWHQIERKRAWREMWQEHRAILIKHSDSYQVFPGDVDGQSEYTDKLLHIFFCQVVKAMANNKSGFEQTMRQTRDSYSDAGLSINELYEIKDKYWNSAQEWHKAKLKKYKAEHPDMSPKMKALKERLEKYPNNVKII